MSYSWDYTDTAATSVDDTLYDQLLCFGPEQRRAGRFTLKDQHLWSITINDCSIPIEYLQDISLASAQVRVRARGAQHLKDQEVLLKVSFENTLVFSAQGRVNGVQAASERLGLSSVKIDFEQTQVAVEALWQTSRLDSIFNGNDPLKGRPKRSPRIRRTTFDPLSSLWTFIVTAGLGYALFLFFKV